MNYIAAMQGLKRIFRALLVLAMLLLGVYIGVKVADWKGGTLRVENTATIIQQVQTLSDLVTVKYVMQKVEIVDSPPESTLGKFVQGDNKVLLLAQGIVKAGIELKKIAPEDVTISGKNLTITLPRPQITDAYLLSLCISRGGTLVTFDAGIPSLSRNDVERGAILLLS